MKKFILMFVSFINEDFDLKSYLGIISLLFCIVFYYYNFGYNANSFENVGILYRLENLLLLILTYTVSILFISKNSAEKATFAIHLKYLGVVFLIWLSTILSSIQLFHFNLFQHIYFNSIFSIFLFNLIYYISLFLFLGLFIGKKSQNIYGFMSFKLDFKPYFILLLLIIPIVFFASTQSSFIYFYPRLSFSGFYEQEYLKYFAFFEPVYLLNFIGIEWIFRGFLVLGLARIFNKNAIIIVAAIYCSFHLGKPLLECISSFFGGYILGIIAYHTKSIWGGVILHIGIAFLMDSFALLHHFEFFY